MRAALPTEIVLPRRNPRPHAQSTLAESAESVNLAGLDFLSLRLVVLCAELGSLSGAAKHAHMSLSCASHRLSTAEEHLGIRLFYRDHLGLHVTAAGAVFVPHAQTILNTLRQALRQLQSAAPPILDTAASPLASPSAIRHGA